MGGWETSPFILTRARVTRNLTGRGSPEGARPAARVEREQQDRLAREQAARRQASMGRRRVVFMPGIQGMPTSSVGADYQWFEVTVG